MNTGSPMGGSRDPDGVPDPASGAPWDTHPTAGGQIRRANVLIVDDHESVSAAWTEALGQHGHVTECISDGRAAQRAIFRAPFHYDLILCDLDLPDMPGKELLQSILPLVRDRTPVVVVSGVSYMIEALGELRQGAFSVLPKPHELSDFHATVEKALEQRSLYLRLRSLKEERDELLHKTNVLLEQNEELSKRVRVDALTQTANRVRLFEDLRALDSNRQRYGAQFAIAMVDIDGFGRFNKRHGVEIGDEVLRRVAASMRHTCRQGDVVYRFGAHAAEGAYRLGGDEFVLVLSAQNESVAISVANRVRMHVEEATSQTQDPLPGGPVTISAGVVANDPEQPRTIDEMLREANERLRRAKEAGGNCVRPVPTEGGGEA